MHETFPVLPAGNGMAVLAAIFGLVMLGLTAVMVGMAFSTKRGAVEVGPSDLTLRAWPYGRTIALADLDLEAARPVDLTAERELRARWRTNGAALPGLQLGWFRLRDKSRALLLVTDRRRVLHVPTRKGYVVQVSVADPPALLAALRAAAGS